MRKRILALNEVINLISNKRPKPEQDFEEFGEYIATTTYHILYDDLTEAIDFFNEIYDRQTNVYMNLLKDYMELKKKYEELIHEEE